MTARPAPRRSLSLVLLLAGTLFTLSPIESAPAEPDEVTISELARGRVVVGARIRVTGKYQERIDDDVVLYDCAVPFRVGRGELSKQLRDLTPKQDNLVIVGTTRRSGGNLVVDVEQLSIGSTDVERLRGELDAIRSDVPDRSERTLEIARRIVTVHKRWKDDELIQLAQRAIRESDEARLQSGTPPKANEDLAFAHQVEDIIGDRDYLIEILTAAIERHPDDPGITARLSALDCRPYQGKWIPYEEFKRLEGLVLEKNRWLTPDEKHLVDTLSTIAENLESSLLLLRRRTEREYVLVAQRGVAETGMTPQEVRAAIGFPQRVRRVPLLGGEFAQWVYEDGYYYFFEGTLVERPEARPKK